MLIYVPHVVCVCMHVSKILLIEYVILLGGGENDVSRGEGERYPLKLFNVQN